MNSYPSLPAPIAALVDAVNRGDTAAFLALFVGDAVVDDGGRRFEGLAAIRAWSDAEFIGANGRMTVTTSAQHGDIVTFEADWRSDLHGGASRFLFVLEGDRVREMRIPAR